MTAGRVRPDRAAFAARSAAAAVVPVTREITADWWTPVGAFHRLAGSEPDVFLLESVEGGERVGRYSFLGRRPFLVVKGRGDELHIEGRDAPRFRGLGGTPLERLEAIFEAYRTEPVPGLPPFTSGAVGYFGYETVRWVERLPERNRPRAPEDDLTLIFLEEVAVFDHVRRRLTLVANACRGDGEDPGPLHDRAVARLDAMETALYAAGSPPAAAPAPAALPEPAANLSPEEFRDRVRRAKEYIAAGDVFQVVLSQRFTVPSPASDLQLYRALRAVNPSPYMFLLRLEEWSAVGSSPEPLLRVTGDRLEYRPIAGTAPRSGDPAEDERRAGALAADPKERAEHVMLVDLGRNDLGRVAATGTVRVEELMVVERYSHVMHLVSGLSGRLRPELGPLDALYACFPAGTVSGAPKVRAMELIEELEPDHRGIYAGAVGYLDFSGNLDTCIALRTMTVRKGRVSVQAGAGIVADSDPHREYEETRHKARALLEAVRLAGGGP
jgi:anthranilate synthase component 1